MTDTNKEILKLTSLWYEYVGMDHHKDRDCHWYINKVWSYGDVPYYRIEHHGYIYDAKPRNNYKTRDAVEKALIAEIKKAFKKELKWANEVIAFASSYDTIQIGKAAWLIKHYENTL